MGVGIQVENLNAWYGKTQALYDIQLTVAAVRYVVRRGSFGAA